MDRGGSGGVLLACAVFGAALALSQAVRAAETKIALVIGNSAYPAARLKNPVNDAKAMADKLRALGFDVALRTDSSQRDMTRAISQFGHKLALGSVGLFYYAGHGMQVRGKNYLIPVDAEIETEGSVSSEAVDVDLVLNQLGPARLSMVILDACRNNPFERKFRSSASGGLAQIDAPTGTLLAYATAPGKVAADGTGSNGLYTEALLKALDTPGLKVEDVFKQVRIHVLKTSDNQQIPWESSSLTGEFYFRAPAPAATASMDDRLRQAEQQRLEMQKALEEERKRRDQDADLIRKEMEKLRAELLQMRTAPTAPAPAASAPAAPAPAVVAAAKPASAPPPAAATAASGASAAEWAQRIALLEQARAKLTYSKAIAILLDLSNAGDLTLVIEHDDMMRRARWQSAAALGVDARGFLIWSGTYQWNRPYFAEETALEYCRKSPGDACTVVMQNGEFRAKDFEQVAKKLGAHSVTAVREAYLKGLSRPPTIITARAGGPMGPPAYAFASAR